MNLPLNLTWKNCFTLHNLCATLQGKICLGWVAKHLYRANLKLIHHIQCHSISPCQKVNQSITQLIIILMYLSNRSNLNRESDSVYPCQDLTLISTTILTLLSKQDYSNLSITWLIIKSVVLKVYLYVKLLTTHKKYSHSQSLHQRRCQRQSTVLRRHASASGSKNMVRA